MMRTGPVRRRSVDDARREILDAAESLLARGGPDAVRVQVVAGEVGVSDAAVHYHFHSHHFHSRDGLQGAVVVDQAAVSQRLHELGRAHHDDVLAAPALELGHLGGHIGEDPSHLPASISRGGRSRTPGRGAVSCR